MAISAAPPRVTFVVATYNYAHYLPHALDSLLMQTCSAWEAIVIDDASTDDTPRVLERYRDDPRIRVVRHATNNGHIRTYNEGIATARGEFVGLLSADDFCVRADAVARQVEVFDAHPEVGFVYSGYAFANSEGETMWVKLPWPQSFVRDGLDEFRHLVFDNYVPASGPLVRRTCHDVVGAYDEQLPHAGDWDLWLRLAARYGVGYVAEPLYAYRMHPVNMHHRRISPAHATSQHVLTARKAFDALGADAPPSVRQLRGAATRNALVRSVAVETAGGRAWRAWQGLADVARRAPGSIPSREFREAAAKVTVLTLLGYRRYTDLAGRYGRRARATEVPQP